MVRGRLRVEDGVDKRPDPPMVLTKAPMKNALIMVVCFDRSLIFVFICLHIVVSFVFICLHACFYSLGFVLPLLLMWSQIVV